MKVGIDSYCYYGSSILKKLAESSCTDQRIDFKYSPYAVRSSSPLS